MKSLETSEYRALGIKTLLTGATLGATAMGLVRYETLCAEQTPAVSTSPQGAVNQPPVPQVCKSLQEFTLTKTTAKGHAPRQITIQQPPVCDQFKLPGYDTGDLENPVVAFTNGETLAIHCGIYKPGGSIIETDSHGVPLALRVSSTASHAHAAELRNLPHCPARPQ